MTRLVRTLWASVQRTLWLWPTRRVVAFVVRWLILHLLPGYWFTTPDNPWPRYTGYPRWVHRPLGWSMQRAEANRLYVASSLKDSI